MKCTFADNLYSFNFISCACTCSGASLGRSLASLKTPVPAKKMQLLWQKAILETMMLIQMNRETQPCMNHYCLLMVFLQLIHAYFTTSLNVIFLAVAYYLCPDSGLPLRLYEERYKIV